MNRQTHRTDEYVQMLPLVSDGHVRSSTDPGAKQALFEQIMTKAGTAEGRMPTAAPAAGKRLRHVAALAAGLGTVAVAGTAWAVYAATGTTAASGCYISEDSVTVIDAVTGDPVRDCASAWERETGAPPPPLVAYDNGTGGVAVVPADREVPGDWTRLEPGLNQDPALIGLEWGLDDSIDGLRSGCHALPAARAIADREIAAAGLSGWQAVSDRGEAADGRSSCTYYLVDAQSQQVVLIPSDGLVTAGDTLPHARMAAGLRERLAGACLSSDEAATRAWEAAAEADVQGLVLHKLPSPETACAAVNLRVGGAVVVTVTGN